MTFTFFG